MIVARAGNGAKSRLAEVLSPWQRRSLALAMLADVVDVCVHSRRVLAGTLAVVDDVALHAIDWPGVLTVADPGRGGMNAAVAAGVAAAERRGATSVVVLPGDVPCISTGDLAALVAAAGDAPRAVVVGVSRDGDGTNALLLRPPRVIAPAFGPPSVDRHLAAGARAGAVTRTLAGLALARDVDTPADLLGLTDADVGPNTAVARAGVRLIQTAARDRLLVGRSGEAG